MGTRSNRGMVLEHMIEASNRTYRDKGMALVTKRPTPIRIERITAGKVYGHLEKASTVDFDGVYQRRALQFEAKQTGDTSLPLANFHEHQITHLRQAVQHGAVAFVIVEFTRKRQTFYLPAERLFTAWDNRIGGRKSIAYDDIALTCLEIKSGRGVPLDYLACVDEVLRQEKLIA
ncbi:Holliday junction resolvase RecU [Tumebacillus permanentifrigoris]|uniref:Holliday junction resolvase RecU n=1 Tax=Tumebacillus permanentifrigoris TaxID=378543 RepID=A0A316D3J7_9BACL|nr:Holliday junction resolvase RecU [Tumebacillus permanentifrigoris]PWK05314.1 recombination protein U [Tumebacillus permanentifrigoris]